jgi:hypothetical protein
VSVGVQSPRGKIPAELCECGDRGDLNARSYFVEVGRENTSIGVSDKRELEASFECLHLRCGEF